MNRINWKAVGLWSTLSLATMWYKPITDHTFAVIFIGAALAGAQGRWIDGLLVAVVFTLGSDIIKVFRGFTLRQILVLTVIAAPVWMLIGGIAGGCGSWIANRMRKTSPQVPPEAG